MSNTENNREITAIKVIKWLDANQDKTFYGLDCRVNDISGWFHMKDDSGPLWYNTRKSALEARNAIWSKLEDGAHGIFTQNSNGRILNLK